MRGYLRSSSFKMAMLFTVLLCLSSAVLGYFSYYFNRGHYIEGAGAVIDTEIQYLVANDISSKLIDAVERASQRDGRLYRYIDSKNNFLAGNLTKITAAQTLTQDILTFSVDEHDYAAKVHNFEDGSSLMVAMDITDAAYSYRIMQWLSFLSIGLMAVVIIVSFLISTFVVSRTNRIAMTAKSIMDTGDLSQRIAIDERWDDLSHMAYVLNSFLQRVETLMQSVRRVSDNIAHDLRTPLTRLLNNLESLRKDMSAANDQRSIERCDSMIHEADHLLATFHALLRIANIETGKQRQGFTTVDLQQIIHDVAELYEPLAEDKEITIYQMTVPLQCQGDRDLLFQCFANLLDNALKFTPPKGHISLCLEEFKNRPLFRITDNGPGIPQKDAKKIFDRFYRGDSSRTTEGNGLGLSLVSAIIELHKAKITLETVHTGTSFKIIF